MTWSAAPPEAALRVPRTAVGRRALQVMLLASGLPAIGLVWGERAHAAGSVETPPEVRARQVISGPELLERPHVHRPARAGRVSGAGRVIRAAGEVRETAGERRRETRPRPSSPHLPGLPGLPDRPAVSGSPGPPASPTLPVTPAGPRSELAASPRLPDEPALPSRPGLPTSPGLPVLSRLLFPPGGHGVMPGTHVGIPWVHRLPGRLVLPGGHRLPAPVAAVPQQSAGTAGEESVLPERAGVAGVAGRGLHGASGTQPIGGPVRDRTGHCRCGYGSGHGHVGRPGPTASPATAGRTSAHCPSGGRPGGVAGGRVTADGRSSRHGDAHAVTSRLPAPLGPLPGACTRTSAGGTRSSQRGVPLFPG